MLPNHLLKFDKEALLEEAKNNAVRETGIHLLAQYWAEHFPSRMQLVTDQKQLFARINQLKEDKLHTEIRMTFFYYDKTNNMTIPFIFMREGKENYIVCPNPINDKTTINLVTHLRNATHLPFLFIEQNKKLSPVSKNLNAMIIGRNATTKNKSSGSYRLPNLLSHWLEKARKSRNHDYIPLEDDLIFSKHKMSLNHYLEIKRIQLTDIMEIQFYLNQLKELFRKDWTMETRDHFILGAKQALKAQGSSLLMNREGLQDYAENFLQKQYLQPTNLLRNFNTRLTKITQAHMPEIQPFVTERLTVNTSAQPAIAKNLKFLLMHACDELLRESRLTQEDWQIILSRQEALINYLDHDLIQKKNTVEVRALLTLTNVNHAAANQIQTVFKELLTKGIFPLTKTPATR